eukprot:761324_1
MLGHKRLRDGQLINETNVKKDPDMNNNSNNKYIEKKQDEVLPLNIKLELPSIINELPPVINDLPPIINDLPSINNNRKNELNVEKTVENKKYCDTLPVTPLAVPMVADILQKSVTRNDAKIITETRLKKLQALSQKPEEDLSTKEKTAKKRIIRLEKNRRAAAMSRRKKKMYVKGLEDKCSLMARHLAILEMENSHLRALLNNSNINNQPTNISHFKLQQQNISNISHFQMPNIPNFINN